MRRALYLAALCTAAALAFAPAASAQTAQYAQPGPTTITATGVLGQPFTLGQDPEPVYPLTDEATGTTYDLVSGFVGLTPFVGQRVTVTAVRVPGPGAPGAPLLLNVTRITPAGGAGGGGALPSTGGLPLVSLIGGASAALGLGVAAFVVRRRAS